MKNKKATSGIRAAIQDPKGEFIPSADNTLTKEQFEEMMKVCGSSYEHHDVAQDEPDDGRPTYTLQELQESDWYKSRPEVIRQAIDKMGDPNKMLRMKSTGKQCWIYSFEEPHSGKLEDVTVTVRKTGVGGSLAMMGLGALDTNDVFGVKLDDLEPWVE